MDSKAQWTHENVIANGIRLHCVTMGEGPLLLLLHGFPECWYSWRAQIPALAAAGYKVVAPDLRGYNFSERPASGYDIHTLTADVLGLMDHYGSPRTLLAGHDWGGAIAWNTAVRHPARVQKLIALNMPHPTKMARALRSNIRQMFRSSYIPLFRTPYLPERLFSLWNYRAIQWMFLGSAVHPERITKGAIEVYKSAARQPGALKAMLAYYREAKASDIWLWARGGPEVIAPMPTLMIWGEKDIALGKELTLGTEEFVPQLTLRYLPDASHWVQQDQPDQVTELMFEFL